MDVIGYWKRLRQGEGGCWIWTGARGKNGYGTIRFEGRYTHAHRVAFRLSRGRDPLPGMEVCHSCDVRLCVNPYHLWEGTRKDNMQDAKAKGRTSPPPRHPVTRETALKGWATRRARASA